jgi:protein disulfide isomerase
MKLILLLILLVFIHSNDDESPKFQDKRDDLIIKLTNDNFDEEIQKHEYLLIEFYTPWSGNSIKLADEFRRAADLLSKSGSSIRIAQANCHEEKELNTRFGITDYPVFKLYKNGELSDISLDVYFAEQIIDILRKNKGPLVREVKNKEEIDELFKQNEKIIVYYGDNKESLELFTQTAEDSRVIFVYCGSECNEDNKEQIVLLIKGNEPETLSFPFTEESIKSLIDNNNYPYISYANGFIVDHVFENNKKVLFYFIKNDDEFVDIIKEVANQYKKKMYFIIANQESETLTNSLLDYFVIIRNELPQIRVSNVISEDEVYHYKFENKFTSDNLKEFINDFLNDKLESYVRSEPIPEYQGMIYKLVAKTFEKEVLNSNKNVLVRFYAPEDGNSKSMVGDYNKLANAFKGVDNLLIAEINVLANELDVPIEGYPTLKLYLVNDKSNPIDYLEKRHFNDMKDFLNEKLGLNIKGDDSQEQNTHINSDL